MTERSEATSRLSMTERSEATSRLDLTLPPDPRRVIVKRVLLQQPAARRQPMAAVRASDARVKFASIALTDLMDAMDQLGAKGADTADGNR